MVLKQQADDLCNLIQCWCSFLLNTSQSYSTQQEKTEICHLMCDTLMGIYMDWRMSVIWKIWLFLPAMLLCIGGKSSMAHLAAINGVKVPWAQCADRYTTWHITCSMGLFMGHRLFLNDIGSLYLSSMADLPRTYQVLCHVMLTFC